MSKFNKKIGVGSLSLLLCIIGILFSFSIGNKVCYGDIILNFLGLKAWSTGSSGIHYTTFYSLIFYLSSCIIGFKFKNNLGATLGKILSLILIIIIILAVPAFVVTK